MVQENPPGSPDCTFSDSSPRDFWRRSFTQAPFENPLLPHPANSDSGQSSVPWLNPIRTKKLLFLTQMFRTTLWGRRLSSIFPVGFLVKIRVGEWSAFRCLDCMPRCPVLSTFSHGSIAAQGNGLAQEARNLGGIQIFDKACTDSGEGIRSIKIRRKLSCNHRVWKSAGQPTKASWVLHKESNY